MIEAFTNCQSAAPNTLTKLSIPVVSRVCVLRTLKPGVIIFILQLIDLIFTKSHPENARVAQWLEPRAYSGIRKDFGQAELTVHSLLSKAGSRKVTRSSWVQSPPRALSIFFFCCSINFDRLLMHLELQWIVVFI